MLETPMERPYMTRAPGRLCVLVYELRPERLWLGGQRIYIYIPPEDEAEEGGYETVMHQVDAVEHLGTGRARTRLRDAEELLELRL